MCFRSRVLVRFAGHFAPHATANLRKQSVARNGLFDNGLANMKSLSSGIPTSMRFAFKRSTAATSRGVIITGTIRPFFPRISILVIVLHSTFSTLDKESAISFDAIGFLFRLL